MDNVARVLEIENHSKRMESKMWEIEKQKRFMQVYLPLRIGYIHSATESIVDHAQSELVYSSFSSIRLENRETTIHTQCCVCVEWNYLPVVLLLLRLSPLYFNSGPKIRTNIWARADNNIGLLLQSSRKFSHPTPHDSF
jgi:hypothetical protein